MVTPTRTIYDPDGNEYVMDWYDRFDEEETDCSFCDRVISGGWGFSLETGGYFAVCDACARTNATTEGR